MFGQERVMTIEHEILKENYDTLVKDYEMLQQTIKHAEESYEAIKLHLQNKAKELEASNQRLLEECMRERSEKEKFKKMFEEMKKTMESERKAMADELMSKSQELSMAKRKEEEEVEKIEKKYVALAEKLDVVEAECVCLKSLYDAEVVAASGTQSAVVSGIGETDNLIGQGENEVNHNANSAGTDAMIISDESDAEHNNTPTPRESNISSHRSVERNHEEECGNRGNSSNEKRALGEIFTPRSANNPPPFPPSSSSSSSSSSPSPSSSSDGYEVVVKLPSNWPEWATPKGPGSGSNKS